MLVNAYCTHRNPPALDFPHEVLSRQDRTSPGLAHHLRGFMGFVMKDKRPMNATRFHVLQHLGRVQHHLSLEVADKDMAAFSRWAAMANAIVFLTDASVRTPDGRMLVAPDTGDAAPHADVPHPVDAVRRKAATDEKLRELGIAAIASLPPVLSEVEVLLRTPREVARRALSLFACAVRGESLAEKNPIPVAQIEKLLPLAFEALTPNERAFLDNEAPAHQEIVNRVWAHEALAVLAWSLSLLPDLPMPTAIVDVPVLSKLMLGTNGTTFVEDAKLRPTPELLDALDLHYRLHWVTTDARVKQKAPPAGLQPGVVLERHRALNWLTRDQDADWDDVDTAT